LLVKHDILSIDFLGSQRQLKVPLTGITCPGSHSVSHSVSQLLAIVSLLDDDNMLLTYLRTMLLGCLKIWFSSMGVFVGIFCVSSPTTCNSCQHCLLPVASCNCDCCTKLSIFDIVWHVCRTGQGLGGSIINRDSTLSDSQQAATAADR